MLASLYIQNYALISQLKANFSNGLTIITGETGAGKSILLGSLGMIMGKRADLSAIGNTNEKCIIEATFDVSKYKLQTLFEALDLDYDYQTIIRREILPSGKSRAFINDSPVNLEVLQTLSASLIDIHSQHQTLELTNDDFQFEIIDALADNLKLIADYQFELQNHKSFNSELAQLKFDQSEAIKALDYNQFLLNELEIVNLESIDLKALEQEYEALSNVEFIAEQLASSSDLLNNESMGLIGKMSMLKQTLSKISNFSTKYEELTQRVESTLIELKDINIEIEDAAEKLEINPSTLETLDTQLKLINNLFQKHNVESIENLLAIREELSVKVQNSFNNENRILQLEQAIATSEKDLTNRAENLHQRRQKAVPILIKQLKEILQNLGMPNADFKLEFTKSKTFKTNGTDDLSFLFSANKGSNFQLLKKAASGGELSRIMMAIKSILSNYIQMPTIMFDEIDTGVSGEIANKMAEVMKQLSDNLQVFAITHLPQIAAKGQSHFKVFKEDTEAQTQTKLKLLNKDERIVEIAQMLSGSNLPSSAIAHAKQLLN